MSIKEKKADKYISKRSAHGVKDIPDTLRRGLRMNDTQRRFALTISTVLVLALACMLWLCIPLLVIGLFAGCRYSFSGKDLDRESINGALGKASEAAERVKKAVAEA